MDFKKQDFEHNKINLQNPCKDCKYLDERFKCSLPKCIKVKK